MKYGVLFIILNLFFQFVAGQDTIRLAKCSGEKDFANKADSIELQLQDQGYEQIKRISVNMESGYELPVIVPLTEGTWYYFVFIANPGARFMETRMYDWNEKMVVYQKQYGDTKIPMISFSYIPKFSEFYMIKPVQLHSKIKKGLCGLVMLFKKTERK